MLYKKPEVEYKCDRTIEKWKCIKNLENKYQISDKGNIWSIISQKFLKVRKPGKYEIITLDKKLYYIHQLVNTHFKNKPIGNNITNHIDHNKKNNEDTNLEWTTKKGNAKAYHIYLNRRIIQYDLNMQIINTWQYLDKIIENYKNFNRHSLIQLIDTNKTYKGFIWKYEIPKEKRKKQSDIELFEDEIFKPIGIFEGKNFSNYICSNYGLVKNIKTNRIIKEYEDVSGYSIVNLINNKKIIKKRVHRLVAFLFCKKIENSTQVHHKNGSKWDNYYLNLEFVSEKTHIEYTFGKKVIKFDLNTKNPITVYKTLADAAKSLNKKFGAADISKCCLNKRKSAYGFGWKYVD